MKMLLKTSFLLLLAAVLFTACEQENLEEIVPEDPGFQPEVVEVNPMISSLRPSSSDELLLDCITIPLPIDFLQQSGSTITINTTEELEEATMLADSIVDFVYPFDAEDELGVIVIDNVEDLVIALTNCEPDTAPNCPEDQDAHVLLFYNALDIFTLNRYVYEINYPVSLDVEGTVIVLNSDEEYLPAIGGDPFRPLATELLYPLTITQFGRVITLNSDSDVCDFYATLDEDCENKPSHIQFFFNGGTGTPINCAYFINYPLEIVTSGDTLVVDSRATYLNALNTTPDAYDNFELVYPVGAARANNGDPLSFESEADICLYLDNCQ